MKREQVSGEAKRLLFNFAYERLTVGGKLYLNTILSVSFELSEFRKRDIALGSMPKTRK